MLNEDSCYWLSIQIFVMYTSRYIIDYEIIVHKIGTTYYEYL